MHDLGGAASTELLVKILLSRWKASAWLQDTLEASARRRLAGTMSDDALEDFIEQQIATEQTELLVEFFWVLRAKNCVTPERMAEWIDRHNELVRRFKAELEQSRLRKTPLGQQHKRRLWRLDKVAHFSGEAKDACCRRLDGSRVALGLRDVERFMALHMDGSLCGDRLDALVRAGLLEDELRPNLRLFRSTEQLDTIVAGALQILATTLDCADATIG